MTRNVNVLFFVCLEDASVHVTVLVIVTVYLLQNKEYNIYLYFFFMHFIKQPNR